MKRTLALVDRSLTTEETMHLDNLLRREQQTKTGSTVSDFKMRDLNGGLLTLSKVRAKYILLEFWSATCAPCRAQHPELIRVYNDLHPKGFEIVSIALDSDKELWRKAVQKDNLPWEQISDLREWNNVLAKKYFVDAIPFNILIDQNRKIVASNLHPEELREKLDALLVK